MQIDTENCEFFRKVNRPPVEDLMVNSKEHKLLKKFRRSLERRYNVNISMPKSTSLDSDVIFVSILGEESNRNKVKRFLAEKMIEPKEDEDKDGGKLKAGELTNKDVVLITLSDSEKESSMESDEDSSNSDDISFIDLCSEDKSGNAAENSLNQSVCIIEAALSSENAHQAAVDSQQTKEVIKLKRKRKNTKVEKKAKLCETAIIEEPVTNIKPADDFIPLIDESKCVKSSEIDNDILVIDEPAKPESAEIPRRLRPVVIDGSNVAMEHGKTSRTFSVKGIQLAIDEFLKRGHTEVVAFVPRYRRNPNTKRMIVTTDAPIFDDLERKQYVVFTPSRRIEGKCINSYDDRFIVEYAASNGGIIVSNDNFRDLLDESESFKEAIKQRLLMFCFVGDKFMLPNDPLGRDGPRLKDFLCFPPDSKKTEENS